MGGLNSVPKRGTGSVVIPAFNESATVAESLRRIATVLAEQAPDRDWEIILVDDGSTDDTYLLSAGQAAQLERPGLRVRVLQHTANAGLGGALRTGFAASRGDIVVVLDCDLSYHPDHIPAMIAELADGTAQVVLASPYMPGGRTVGVPRYIERRSRVANKFIAAVSKLPVHTYTGMVRAYQGDFLRALSLKSLDERINVEILYKAEVLRARVVEIPAVLDWSGLTHRSLRSTSHDRDERARIYRIALDGLLFRPYLVFVAGGSVLSLAGLIFVLLSAVFSPPSGWITALGASLIGAGLVMACASLLSLQIKRSFEEMFYLGSARDANVSRVIEPGLRVVERRTVPGQVQQRQGAGGDQNDPARAERSAV